MLTRLIAARYLHGHRLWLRFADGLEGEVDLGVELDGEMFEPLRDEGYFGQVVFNPEIRTVVWPNGADFAPEFLRAALRVPA
jgi:hypothetical protein